MGMSIKAIWNYKCPRCRKGNMFIKPLVLTDPLNMHKHCDACNLDFDPEPGYYFGAMFLSYIISGWLILMPTLLLVFYFDWSVNAAMLFAIGLGALCYLKLLRGSRALWLHFNVKYNPDANT